MFELPFVSRKEYEEVVYKLECLLCHATGGRFSKSSYSIVDMEHMVDDYIESCIDNAVEEEQVHGHWIEDDGVQICSNCGEEHEWEYYRAPFCDQCGAMMDEEAINGETQTET